MTPPELIYPDQVLDRADAAEIEPRQVEQVLEEMGFREHTLECNQCGHRRQVLAKPEAVASAGLEGDFSVPLECDCSDDSQPAHFVEELTN